MVKVNLRTCLISIFFVAALCTATFGKIIYVDDGAGGANDGTSWENAYVYLQDALADAIGGDEIRVAQGIYTPDLGGGNTPGDRRATFQLINNVTLKGGFAGIGELDPNIRDVELYETILSGDLNGNDLSVDDLHNIWSEPTRAENSYHVVTGSDTDETSVLDGFTITAGNANVPFGDLKSPHDNYSQKCGAGMYNVSGSPTLIDCTFCENSANWGWSAIGGGMYNLESSPRLSNCIFKENISEHGGGMGNCKNSNPILTNCIFHGNVVGYDGDGAGMYNSSSDPILNNCTFDSNKTYGATGGGMYNSFSNPILTNCKFTHNEVDSPGRPQSSHWFYGNGGGMANSQAAPRLVNCTFIGNKANFDGGGIFSIGSKLTLNNCILSGNSGNYGGGMLNSITEAILTNCTFVRNSAESGNALACIPFWSEDSSNIELINCVLWDGGNEIWNESYIPSTISIKYSNIQGGFPGEGNIDVDPLFADGGFWADANEPNISVEPNEPNAVWIDGDYHLKSEAGRLDPVSESWIVDDVTSLCIDAGDPNSPVGDELEPNGGIINMGAYGGTAEASMSPTEEEIVYVQWLGHSSVKVWTDDCIVYVDPQNLSISPHDATLVCVTHTHGDHYSPSDIARVSNAETQFIAPPDVVQRYGSGQTIAPGQTIEFDFVNVKAVPSYNTNKPNHPKSNNWVGFIIELGGKRIYVAGDTDLIEEMKSLGDINVAILPAGGTYTMNATEAAEATEYIKPDLAIPYHWGRNVGTLRDAEIFAELARCPAQIMAVGETISSDNWPVYSPLIAHWALDEAEGDIAHDSAGENHGTLYGDPVWQPAGGKIDGALQLDGIDDYISTDFVVNPADGAFSVFAWITGGAPRQVIISQADILAGRSIKPGNIWLGVDPSDGKLMTGLGLISAGSPIPPLPPLMSESVITDGEWHHIGFVWDGSYRALYVDGTEAAKDTAAQNPLKSADSGMYIGAGPSLDAASFFSGLIDDIRIYDMALTAKDIAQLAD